MPHRAGVQRGVFEHADAKGHVGAPFEQLDDAFVGVQLQFHLGVARTKSCNRRHQHMQHEGGGCIDTQSSRRPYAPRRHQLLRFVHRCKNGTGMLQEGGAFLGEFQTSGRAAQQRGLQLFFQASQRAAGSRNCQAQQLRSGRNGPRVHDGHKGLQFIERGLHC